MPSVEFVKAGLRVHAVVHHQTTSKRCFSIPWMWELRAVRFVHCIFCCLPQNKMRRPDLKDTNNPEITKEVKVKTFSSCSLQMANLPSPHLYRTSTSGICQLLQSQHLDLQLLSEPAGRSAQGLLRIPGMMNKYSDHMHNSGQKRYTPLSE